ncbi:hypothetical protein CPB83DRAFT_863984 [Crepidotus variabilis]|uniref:BTB domain-containing protein n=1 Tax=Crepidotus variabilis TaxID=179855 RepID=A0A9P6JIZ7_9AGAR|nr:hypothetical protein CPB83DRAFT_863984 [Crepidotus variabilis]
MDLNSAPVILPTDGAAIRERHEIYYFELVLFEVETTLFNIPKNAFLRSNPKFFDQFTAAGASPPSDEHEPMIELKGVTVQAFEGLLRLLYPVDGTNLTYEAWLGALELATRWDFPDIRAKAIKAMTTMHEASSRTTIEIVALAKKYRVKPWLRDSYIKLVQQKDLKLEDLLQILDCETTMRLFTAQSYILRVAPPSLPQGFCGNCNSGYGYSSCSYGCYQRGNQCDNCINGRGHQNCTNLCQNRPKTTGLDDAGKVAVEVDRIFCEEFASMREA